MKKFLLLLFFLLSISSNTLGFIRDSEIENLIKDIIAPIANAANQDKKKLKIFIIDDKQLNAFVTPGQKIFIFSGLILNSKKLTAWIYPTIYCFPTSLICLLYYLLDILYKFFCYGTPGIDIKCKYIPSLLHFRTSEIIELYISFFLLIYILSINSRLKNIG
mgnify:CR=1 FL=1